MFPFIETIHVERFEAHLLSEHLSRIQRTCKEVFGVDRDIDLIGADVLQIATETQEKNRLTVFYNEADHKFVSRIYTPKKVRQFLLAEANDLDYHLKYADRTPLENLKKHLNDEDEVIIIQNGEVTDTTFSNICFFQTGRWFTPARPLFDGIKRKFYLEKRQIAEKRIKVEDIFHYEKICLINSMLDIHQSEYPIHSIRTE